MNLRASRPVPDKEAYQFIVDNINGNSLYKAMSEPNSQKELNKKLKNLNLKSTISARDAASVLGISYKKFYNIFRHTSRTKYC